MTEKKKGKAPKTWKVQEGPHQDLILESKVFIVGKSLAMMLPQDVVGMLKVEKGDFIRVKLGSLEVLRNGHTRSRLLIE